MIGRKTSTARTFSLSARAQTYCSAFLVIARVASGSLSDNLTGSVTCLRFTRVPNFGLKSAQRSALCRTSDRKLQEQRLQPARPGSKLMATEQSMKRHLQAYLDTSIRARCKCDWSDIRPSQGSRRQLTTKAFKILLEWLLRSARNGIRIENRQRELQHHPRQPINRG